MSVEFYNVKLREKVSVDESAVKKTKFERTTKAGAQQIRYAVVAESNGVKMTKFVNKETWDALCVPEI